MTTSTPSFFLLSSQSGDGDAGGAWTKVTKKKPQRKATKHYVNRRTSSAGREKKSNGNNKGKRRPKGSISSSSSEDNNNSCGKNTSPPVNNKGISWSVPHGRDAVKPVMKTGSVESKPIDTEIKSQWPRPHPQAVKSPRVITRQCWAGPQKRISDAETSQMFDSTIQTKVDENEREKLRLKIWNILFRNVNRTIDELYYMCEFDSSEEQCAKAEELLGTYLSDFRELKQRIQTQDEFSKKGDSDAADARETSKGLAWEVRKSNASPSPVTLLFGSRLKESSDSSPTHRPGDSGQEAESGTILRRRSLKQLSFSSQSVNKEWKDPDTRKHLPKSSAWRKKPNIISDDPPKRSEFSTINQQVAKHSPNSPRSNKDVVLRTKARVENQRTPTFFIADRSREEIEEMLLQEEPEHDSRVEQHTNVAPTVNPSHEHGPEVDFEESEPHMNQSVSPQSGGSHFDDDGDINIHDLVVGSSDDEDDDHATLEPRENSVFIFDDDEKIAPVAPSLRWGDEEVGLTPEDAALLAPISPKRKQPCVTCGRHVIGFDSEETTCTACMSLAASKMSNSSREIMMRALHQKLSSPERRKPSPSETKRRQVEKQATARLNREMIELQRQAKLRLQSSRQEQAAKTKEEGILAQERAICERLERAAVAREAKLKSVAKKAENESIKVNEIQFINEMTELEKTAQFRKKMEDGEKRRQEFIGKVRGKAGKQSERAEALRLREKGKEKLLREAMQKRHEDAEKRKAEALEEQRRRLDEMLLEASAKVTERRTEMEKEREARIMLIKEREERAEQERMKHLLAKRAVGRTSTSSPLLTQQMAHGQGYPSSPSSRATYTNNDQVFASPPPELMLEKKTANGDDTLCERDAELERAGRSEFQLSDGLVPTNREETAEERNARFALEESRSSKELQVCEKQMKKKSKKVKTKIAALCALAVSASLPVTSPSTSKRKNNKITRAVRNVQIESKRTDAVNALLRAIKNENSKSDVTDAICENINELLPALLLPLNGSVPLEKACTLEFLARVCELKPEVGVAILVQNHASKLIDLSVSLLRNPIDAHELPVLVSSLWLLRVILSIENDEKAVAINTELARLCVFSSLLRRLGERCAQIHCLQLWFTYGKEERIDLDQMVKHVDAVLGLVRNSLGLLEILIKLVLENDKQSPVFTTVVEAARGSLLFRVVSQIVAAFILIEYFDKTDPRKKAIIRTHQEKFARILLVLAQSGLRVLNLLALLDLELVQETLGSPALPFELQQLFRFILELSNGEDDIMPSPPSITWEELRKQVVREPTVNKEALFAELVVLMGFYAQCNEKNQESLNWGRSPTPLTSLCSVPFRYFSSAVGKSILFPTLLSICHLNSRALNIIAEEINPSLLASYLSSNKNNT
eukprot:CAMPEP_0203746630 /NCGR_PEP_ID=MMETSP0098-20131031/2017_1 /ASSEMBLY_ACC=CAM_ASM_000208 /TAXON_ID=96639 /ORGANISM=" , Strain NY0313808BC1" /LENGTH=1387 /DNA_ID=CAMNT_0050634795 /DNA_START=524 /DNA_END=4684 /DNA_ORIENTATION=+